MEKTLGTKIQNQHRKEIRRSTLILGRNDNKTRIHLKLAKFHRFKARMGGKNGY